uniref:Uncharacterized protein n=1 Tax=Vitis vinifera TaxID=29760 RepID=F6H1X0_VITVI
MLSMEKRDVSSMEESLDLALLPKGPPVPPSSPSGEGYAMVNINGKLFTLHLPSINDRGAMTAGRGADGYITIPVCASQADSSPLMAMEMTATMQSSYGGGQ